MATDTINSKCDFAHDKVNSEDMGLLYGFSLFETFCVDKLQRVFLVEKHIERILESADFFHIDAGIDRKEMNALISKYIEENNIADSIVRMTLTAGNKVKEIAPSVLFSNRENVYTPEKIAAGCKLCLSDIRKSESSIILRHKTANYLENYFSLQTAIGKGFDDALFLNSKGKIAETTKCNIFFAKDNRLYTPHENCGLLPGIIRRWVLKSVNSLGIQCIEGEFGINELLDADEVFVTNSAMGIMRVNAFGDKAMKANGESSVVELLSSELNSYWNRGE